MNAEQLEQQLSDASLVQLTAEEWTGIAGEFELVERHRTSVAGDLLIVRGKIELFAVEQPTPETRVARVLSDIPEASRFVAERMDQYERMWDGCGCRIDYNSLEW
ncbi:MAG: hypothetical protein JSW51_08020 [Gemmatimonadota bacterium]|nr:MAG: hypothetical protein JSW51_08020 [Gemmatimonadota bacterium]